jgi:hypothetical protein
MSELDLPTFSVAPVMLLLALTGSVLLVVIALLRNEAVRREIEGAVAETRRLLTHIELFESATPEIQQQLKIAQDARDKAIADESALIRRLQRGRLDRLELVHELGRPEFGMGLYRTELAPNSALAVLPPKDVVFSRQIWAYRNVADAWAESEGAAAFLLEAAFPNRGGVTVTRILAVEEPTGP